jgi:hypothetical protein
MDLAAFTPKALSFWGVFVPLREERCLDVLDIEGLLELLLTISGMSVAHCL